uniref:Uncharacterized protein n=1 Tax=Arundo donax TaxID=35708 RepID=A0A0A9EPV8_ARUDO
MRANKNFSRSKLHSTASPRDNQSTRKCKWIITVRKFPQFWPSALM